MSDNRLLPTSLEPVSEKTRELALEKVPETVIEIERYELSAPSAYHFALDRREFFRILGAGVLIFGVLKNAAAFQESGAARRPSAESMPKAIAAWLHIGENGLVTVYTGKVEVGQNIRTSLSQAVAEELHVSPIQIKMVMGDTKLTPFDMGTFGSRTTPTMNLQLRKVAAAAHDLLIGLAAKNWQVDPKGLTVADGKITEPQSNRAVTYAELVKGRELSEAIPAEDPLTPARQWTIDGQSVPKIEGRDFVTGAHRYPCDQKLPGMLHGKVLRPSSFGAQLASADTGEAEKIPGVTVVRDDNFIGITAPSAELASRALATIRAEWKSASGPTSPSNVSNKDVFDYLKKNPIEEKGREGSRHQVGSVEQGFAAADQRLKQTYTVAYIAHCPLEPRAALAQWSGDSLTAWTGTQRPFGVRTELAEAFRIPEDHVRVLMPDMGSGYGGKHTGEAAVEAARLARAAKQPVKLVWTREEEFTWAYFRPAGVIEVSSGVRSDGTISAWEFHNYNSGPSGIRTYYDIPNQSIEFHQTRYPLRQGSYRGLAATANHFARESHMDELAHSVKMDPLEFRLKNLKDERLRAVFEAAAKKIGWGGAKTLNHGFGIAGGFEKGGNVATCVEVTTGRAKADQARSEVKVIRVVTAFECGAIVNPDHLRTQIEGANIMGLGGALFEAIDFADGRILNAKFSKYRVPRFSDTPLVETVLLDRKDIPSAGAGETPIVGLAPAIGNAIFDATGVRLRSLPMVPDGLNRA
ncbi:MAG TPA: molybdopterin cofactor-binding domain-containing protein [Candidatus Dormibacteraeota bacterium]|nr:molybdopterin cofactor-binding domain-containing protein [Candidatus Dormibacteraeota bacterium]